MSTKNKVELQFPDMYKLWKFAQEIHSTSIEINTRTKTLICHCAEEEIGLAISNYGATILEVHFNKV